MPDLSIDQEGKPGWWTIAAVMVALLGVLIWRVAVVTDSDLSDSVVGGIVAFCALFLILLIIAGVRWLLGFRDEEQAPPNSN